MKTKTIIEVNELDTLVRNTYGIPYSFQQQEGCKGRGIEYFTVPAEAEDFEATSIPEKVNGPIYGVSFETWLARDPKQNLPGKDDAWYLDLFYARNFYPEPQTLLNDLHSKGMLPAGEYGINIDW